MSSEGPLPGSAVFSRGGRDKGALQGLFIKALTLTMTESPPKGLTPTYHVSVRPGRCSWLVGHPSRGLQLPRS